MRSSSSPNDPHSSTGPVDDCRNASNFVEPEARRFECIHPRHWQIHGADDVMIGAMIVHRNSVQEIVKHSKSLGRTMIVGGPLFTTGHCHFDFCKSEQGLRYTFRWNGTFFFAIPPTCAPFRTAKVDFVAAMLQEYCQLFLNSNESLLTV